MTHRGGLRSALAALLLVGCALPPVAVAPQSAPAGLQVVVLGIAQDGGVPHLGCERPCCEAARRSGNVLYPASLGVVDRDGERLLLIEATPQIEAQIALLHDRAGVHGRGRRPVDAVLLTHAHIGHYLGLAHFGREVASTTAMPVWCSPRMSGFLRANGPWRQLVELQQIELHEVAPRTPFAPLQGLEVRAIPVPHRDEYSDTMAFVLRGPRRTVLFVPDVDSWERAPGLLAELLAGVDVAYVDGTFFDGSELPERNLAEIRHPLMTETMAALAALGRARPGAVRFLHCNHTNPALRDPAVRARITALGFAVAEQGETFDL